MEEEAKELGKVVTKLRTKAETKERTTKVEASGREASEARPSSLLFFLFVFTLTNISPSLKLYKRRKTSK